MCDSVLHARYAILLSRTTGSPNIIRLPDKKCFIVRHSKVEERANEFSFVDTPLCCSHVAFCLCDRRACICHTPRVHLLIRGYAGSLRKPLNWCVLRKSVAATEGWVSRSSTVVVFVFFVVLLVVVKRPSCTCQMHTGRIYRIYRHIVHAFVRPEVLVPLVLDRSRDFSSRWSVRRIPASCSLSPPAVRLRCSSRSVDTHLENARVPR